MRKRVVYFFFIRERKCALEVEENGELVTVRPLSDYETHF